MKKIIIIIILIVAGYFLYQKFAPAGKELAKDAGTIANKETGVTDIGVLNAAELSFAKARAKEFYNSLKLQGEDLSNGPCLSNNLTTNWVADLVHNPRQAVDDQPENQCSAYINGTAKHFVELDLSGNFVRGQ